MANSFIDAQRVHREKKINIIMVILTILAILYICARGSYYMKDNPDTPEFIALATSLMTIAEAPFAVLFDRQCLKLFGLTSVVAGFAAWCAVDSRILNRHYTDGEQFGTARWQTVQSIKLYNKKFTEPIGKSYADSPQNTILSKHCQLSMNTRHTGMNNNVMIIGGPGSGKCATRFLLKRQGTGIR